MKEPGKRNGKRHTPPSRAKEKCAPRMLSSASIPATVVFTVFTLALLMLAVQLIIGAAGRSLTGKARDAAQTPPAASAAPLDAASHAEDEPASEAAAVRAPATPAVPTPTAAPTPHAPGAAGAEALPEADASQNAPQSSAEPFQAGFGEGRLDVFLPVFGEDGKLLYLAVLAVRAESTTFLFAPGNLLCADGLPLSARRSPRSALTAFSGIFPVQYPYYVRIYAHEIGACVDAVGGVSLAGKRLTGDEAERLVTEGGSDELLRIEKLQSVIAAYLRAVQEAGLLRLVGSKAALNACTDGNLTAAQYVALYQAVKRTEISDIVWRILPVDSVIVEGERFYRADAALCAALAASLYAD